MYLLAKAAGSLFSTAELMATFFFRNGALTCRGHYGTCVAGMCPRFPLPATFKFIIQTDRYRLNCKKIWIIDVYIEDKEHEKVTNCKDFQIQVEWLQQRKANIVPIVSSKTSRVDLPWVMHLGGGGGGGGDMHTSQATTK